jgi:lysophospholipase L1-like esterase
MTKKIFFTIGFVVLVLISDCVNAQPFKNEIDAFKKVDSLHSPYFPGKHPILFVGSSSFRKWVDVQDYFPGYPIINRGFGGSTLPDVIRYAADIIYPYAPKQVVIYCGENDLASSDKVTAKVVFERFKTLFQMIRTKLPYATIDFVSIKPSPSRKHIQPQVIIANKLIKDFLAKKIRAGFINIYDGMMNADGTMKGELFLSDNLHMKANGYAIWQKAIAPYLLKDNQQKKLKKQLQSD